MTQTPLPTAEDFAELEAFLRERLDEFRNPGSWDAARDVLTAMVYRALGYVRASFDRGTTEALVEPSFGRHWWFLMQVADSWRPNSRYDGVLPTRLQALVER